MPCGGVPVEMPAVERRWLGIEELAVYLKALLPPVLFD